ncbi:MAG: alpha/beta fold hydrolase [Halothiobacillus sp.]|nr:alpha/beta fold hydrolase [Halothiobacillus sp.]
MIDGLVEGCVDGSGLKGRASIVLVSGWSFDSSMWRNLVDGYVARGGDRSVIHPLDWLEFGHWIFDGANCPVAEKYSGKNVLWLGWSLGGALILEALARKQLSPRQSVILSASPRFLQDERTGWLGMPLKNWQALRRQVGRSPEAALNGFDTWLGLPAGFSRQQEVGALQQGLDWLAAIDQRAWLARATRPIHWVFGSDDPLLPTQPWADACVSEFQLFTPVTGGHALPWRHEDYLMNLMLTYSARGIEDV